MSLTRTIAAAVAALAVAAPAASAAPAGHHDPVLEFAKLTTISGSAGNDGTTFLKVFASDAGSHLVYTDEATGALKSETAVNPRIWKAFDPAANTITLRDGFTGSLVPTPAEEARYFQQGVEQGCYVKTGSDDANRLDHYKMVDDPQLPCADDPNTQETDLVDQRTGYVVDRITTNGTFRQETSLAYTKVHDEPGAKRLLKLAPHPGATVVDERG
jgi:hypothetical protein